MNLSIKFFSLLSFVFVYTVSAEVEIIKNLERDEKEVERLMKLDEEADLSINYNPYTSKLDVNIGVVNNNIRTPILFSLKELHSFSPHKNIRK